MGKAVAPGRAGQSGQGAPEFFRGGTAGIVSGHQRVPGHSGLLPQAVSVKKEKETPYGISLIFVSNSGILE